MYDAWLAGSRLLKGWSGTTDREVSIGRLEI